MNYYYCYSIKKGLFDKEMQYAKDLGVYIFYDEKEDKFYDKEHNLIEIKDKKIFPRTSAIEATSLIKAIVKHDGKSLVTEDDYEKTLNWPYYVKTKRKNIILTGKQIFDNQQLIKDIFGSDKVFFKTKFKNFSQIIEVEQFTKVDSPFQKALKVHENDNFIISDAVSIIEDNYGPREYRAFIVNGEILNISRVSDYLLETIDKEIINKLKDIISHLKETNFPKSYVIDIFEYRTKNGNKEIDVLECNPIIASGTYLYNTIFEISNDIEHKCPSTSIPKEKLKYGNRKKYSFNALNESMPSICYNLPGGFAADLTSFSIFGTKSSKNMYFHFDIENNKNWLDLSSIFDDLIEDDSDLMNDSEEIDIKKLTKIKEDKNLSKR